MTNFADGLSSGPAVYQRNPGQRGAPISNVFVVQFGAVTTATENSIADQSVATGAGTLVATGALVSGGIATLDVARIVSLTGTGDNSLVNFTLTGKDVYGASMTQTLAGPNATTVYTTKAFKTLTSIAVDAATASGIDVGMGATLGLPYKIADAGKITGITINGDPSASGNVAVTAGTATSLASTATTADVRGTIAFSGDALPNASRLLTASLVFVPTTQATLYGNDQA